MKFLDLIYNLYCLNTLLLHALHDVQMLNDQKQTLWVPIEMG